MHFDPLKFNPSRLEIERECVTEKGSDYYSDMGCRALGKEEGTAEEGRMMMSGQD